MTQLGALRDRLKKHRQEHLLEFADELDDAQRRRLMEEIAGLDFDRLARLFEESKQSTSDVDANAVEPIESIALSKTEGDRASGLEAKEIGLKALAAGKVAVVLVAGGQGSRLGFEHPKGMYPIGPVAGTSLFQIHAEKIQAWRMKVGANIPWYIMTSPGNHDETIQYFENHRYFGLPKEHVRFFVQGTMPALDLSTGRVLLADKGEVFLGPDGHGGTLTALQKSGCLEEMRARGIDSIYYFQVDNAFVKILDPTFLGYHLNTGADVALKVIRKQYATEKLGLVVRYQGKPTIIEYSDLPSEVGTRVGPAGELLFWTGSIAIHVFRREFLERITAADVGLPVHFAKKAVPYIDEKGVQIRPEKPNGLKFETFIFDCLPMAQRVTVVETDRTDEYEPVKNAEGEHSPGVVRAAITRQAAQWLDAAGIGYPKNAAGEPTVALEISPLAGLDAADFSRNYKHSQTITNPTYFSTEGAQEIV